MLGRKYTSNIDSICPICSSENTILANSHLYLNIRCKDCQHEAILSKEQNLEKFANKTLKKSQIKQSFSGEIKNVIEYSYCPYWTLMKIYDKTSPVIVAKKQKDIILCHSFSDKSIRIYAKNLLIPNIVSEKENFYVIDFQ